MVTTKKKSSGARVGKKEVAVPREIHATMADVRARISPKLKSRASKVLDAQGLSLSDAIRLLMVEIVAAGDMPFAVKRPNAVSRAAIRDAEAGKVVSHKSIDDLMADLNA